MLAIARRNAPIVAGRLGHPKETKGQDCQATSAASQCCDGGSCC